MSLSDLAIAPLAINGYLWDTFKAIEPTFAKKYANKMPFFPVSDAASGQKQWENKPYIIYDRMFKFSRGSFYPIKQEQLVYVVKGNEAQIFEWGAGIQMILDRGDDSAKDVNNWIRNNGGNDKYPVYFHSMKVYQTRPMMGSAAENARDFSTRPYYMSDFFVDMDYHITSSLESYL